MMSHVISTVERMIAWFSPQDRDLPPDSPRDPYAMKPVPLRPRPTPRTGAVAVAEPDD